MSRVGSSGIDWTPERAERVAAGLGFSLGPEHWRVVACARELAASLGHPPAMPLLCARLGLSEPAIAALFPGDAGAILVRVAGV